MVGDVFGEAHHGPGEAVEIKLHDLGDLVETQRDLIDTLSEFGKTQFYLCAQYLSRACTVKPFRVVSSCSLRNSEILTGTSET